MSRSAPRNVLKGSVEDRVLQAVRESGYIPLYRLGSRLGLDPKTLENAINNLRRQGKVSGSAAEGRGATEEERRYWIVDVSGSGKIGAVTPRG